VLLLQPMANHSKLQAATTSATRLGNRERIAMRHRLPLLDTIAPSVVTSRFKLLVILYGISTRQRGFAGPCERSLQSGKHTVKTAVIPKHRRPAVLWQRFFPRNRACAAVF